MPAAKLYAAVENAIIAVVNAEIAHRATQKEQDPNKTAEEAKEEAEGELLELKKKGQLCYQSLIDGKYVGHFQSSAAKGLLPELEEKVAEAIKKHNVKDKQEWFARRVMRALPKKTRMTGAGSTKRKIGEMCDKAARSREGRAIETALKSEGLLMEFEGGELTPLMEALVGIIFGKKGLNNKCYVFSEARKKEIAIAKCMERNKLVATIQDDGQGQNAVTNGMEVEDYIKKYGSIDGLALLENQSRELAKEKARGRVIDDNTIHAAGSLIWTTGAKIIADYFNIKEALDHPNVCAAKDKKGSWRILVCGEKKMKRQNCVGSVIANDCEYDDFERELTDCQNLFVELFTTSEKPLVVDTNAKTDPSSSDDPRYKKIKLADTDRYVRAVCITERSGQKLTTFQCKYGESSEKDMKHHRLVAIYEHHFGWGFNQNPLIMEYLGLKDGESFEDHERFKYHQGLSDRSIRNMLKRKKYLDKRKWEERKLAKWSDVDHLLGRSKRWKNSNFFCMHVSHSWNQAMSFVRICYGDWLYGFANIQYNSGSD